MSEETPVEKKHRLREESKKLRREARAQIIGYILAALGLVAGLAWNDAVKAAIEHFFNTSSQTITAKFLYAVIITVIIIVVSMLLLKLKPKDLEDK